MEMIQNEMISVDKAAEIALEAAADPSCWESIVINRRKPHTYRAFIQFEASRICLHRFDACDRDDSFSHPHPWPSSMLILSGKYEMAVGRTPDLLSSEPSSVIFVTLSAGSVYHMLDQHTWHKVIPRTQCYSLMVNGPRWVNAHQQAPSTKGKRLEPMGSGDLVQHLAQCRQLLTAHLNSLRKQETI